MIRYKWEKNVWYFVAILEIYLVIDFFVLNS